MHYAPAPAESSEIVNQDGPQLTTQLRRSFNTSATLVSKVSP